MLRLGRRTPLGFWAFSDEVKSVTVGPETYNHLLNRLVESGATFSPASTNTVPEGAEGVLCGVAIYLGKDEGPWPVTLEEA